MNWAFYAFSGCGVLGYTAAALKALSGLVLVLGLRVGVLWLAGVLLGVCWAGDLDLQARIASLGSSWKYLCVIEGVCVCVCVRVWVGESLSVRMWMHVCVNLCMWVGVGVHLWVCVGMWGGILHNKGVSWCVEALK